MKTQSEVKLKKRIKFWIAFFIISLVLSGVTAFAIEAQLEIVVRNLSHVPGFLREWVDQVYSGVKATNDKYPFISYGTDWLAFAHIIIAIAFIGPYINPVKNIWVIQFGMIACLLIIPLALIAGTIREIPFYWILIDCSFGILGIIPLYYCYKGIRRLEHIQLGDN
ncbi:MAG: hypothetical protein IIA45_12300 [Bacteroidetes bacterium]|nr:hypothetical protein [Bacteroidota bacterium]